MSKADAHYNIYRGPLSVVRACMHCKHTESYPVGRRGVGRGYGMAESAKARGRMIRHIRDAHPEVIDE